MKGTPLYPRPHAPGLHGPLARRAVPFLLVLLLSVSFTLSDDDILSAWKAQRTATQN